MAPRLESREAKVRKQEYNKALKELKQVVSGGTRVFIAVNVGINSANKLDKNIHQLGFTLWDTASDSMTTRHILITNCDRSRQARGGPVS